MDKRFELEDKLKAEENSKVSITSEPKKESPPSNIKVQKKEEKKKKKKSKKKRKI